MGRKNRHGRKPVAAEEIPAEEKPKPVVVEQPHIARYLKQWMTSWKRERG